jgi:hypothetical protein
MQVSYLLKGERGLSKHNALLIGAKLGLKGKERWKKGI